jgi:hypothetical protein
VGQISNLNTLFYFMFFFIINRIHQYSIVFVFNYYFDVFDTELLQGSGKNLSLGS